MKGLTHFVSGVAISTFLAKAVAMSWTESSFILVLGGLFGIMPDTLDFKVGQFFSKADYEVDCDPNEPDPQKMAEQIGKAMDEAYESGRLVKCQLYPMRLGVDLWRQYVIKFDGDANEVVVIINDIVTTSQKPYIGTAPKENRVGRYKIKGNMLETHGRPSVVDIMSGPQYGFKRVKDWVEVEFLPWHRTWSHSYILGLILALPVWIIASLVTSWSMGWLYGLVAFLGFSIHLTEDLTGHMGGSLLWPFKKERTSGLCLFKASNPHANFSIDYACLCIIVWNINRLGPAHRIFHLPGAFYLFATLIIPLGIYFSVAKVFGEKGKKKKLGVVSAEAALAADEDAKNDELRYEIEDVAMSD